MLQEKRFSIYVQDVWELNKLVLTKTLDGDRKLTPSLEMSSKEMSGHRFKTFYTCKDGEMYLWEA